MRTTQKTRKAHKKWFWRSIKDEKCWNVKKPRLSRRARKPTAENDDRRHWARIESKAIKTVNQEFWSTNALRHIQTHVSSGRGPRFSAEGRESNRNQGGVFWPKSLISYLAKSTFCSGAYAEITGSLRSSTHSSAGPFPQLR